MIKMYINNEEVVSNKEFTISEEMLATPSTVLNNCYPALWENTKDYVSKFYFPKDYSKCIIGDGEFEKGSQRNIIKKVNGISPSFETNITKPWESLTIDGNSYQATSTDPVSPSPDYPSEIENVKGKNLLDNKNPNYIVGATWKPTETGGKISASTTWNWVGWNLKLNMDKQYTFSYGARNSKNIYLYIRTYTDATYSTIKTKIVTDGINLQNTFKPDSEYVRIAFTNNAVIEDIEIPNIQLKKGSVATRYAPYGNIQIVETGDNLWQTYSNTTLNGITLTQKNNGNILLNGTATRDTFLRITLNKFINEATTLSCNYKSGTIKGASVFVRTRTSKLILNHSINIGPATTTGIKLEHKTAENYYQEITIQKGAMLSNVLLEVMFLKGTYNETNLPDYEPYKEEVVNIDLKGNELCSLPNGTKDGLIVKDGRAKIPKKIKEVILDGSDDYNWGRDVVLGVTRFYKRLNGAITTSGRHEILSNYFKFSNNGHEVGIGFVSSGLLYLYPKSDITTIDEFKTWLSTHNTIVQYELETPEEIDLGEITLPNTLIGQNNVTLDATLETNMEISYYYSSYDLLFAGVVKKTGNISLNPRYPHYADIQVLDFKTFLSEGETLNFVIDNKTIGQAIDMVIDAIKSYGFIKGNIMLEDINEVIGAYSTDKKTAYDVFQYFSDITNSRWFTRMIDEDTVAIDFYDTDKLPVKPKIEYTEDWFCNNLIDDMSYSIKTDDYRNKQILLSDEVFGSTPYNDLLTSNGYDTSYTTTGKIASLTSAKIDGKNATFTTEANKEGGVEADIYYKPGEVGITTNNQIGAGKVIEITYIPLVEGREIIINDEEVNRIGSQLNRNGVISRYENRNDTTSSDELRQIGQTYIKYKGKAEVTLKITSRKNIYNIGDKVQFDAPLEDLSTEYMVKKKTTKYIVTANQLFYDYELSSSFNSESEINYFDNQRSKHKGNLSEGDYITRDIDITNSANIIWHDTSIDEISITGNNILDCALDSPFTD